MKNMVITYGWLGYFLLSILTALLNIGELLPLHKYGTAICVFASAALLVLAQALTILSFRLRKTNPINQRICTTFWLVMAAALVLLLCFADIANQSRGFAYDVSFGVVVLAIAFLSSWAGFNFLEVGWIYPLVYGVIAVNGAVMLLYLLWDRRQRRGQTTK